MRNILYMIGIFLLITIISSCQRRSLTYDYYPYSDIVIEPDWSQSLTGAEKPLGVSAWFYPKEGGAPLQFRSNSVDGFSVPIVEGKYDVLVFNRSETEFSTIGFRGIEKLSTIEIYSLSDETKGWYTKADNELVVLQPEKIATAIYRDFEVTAEMVTKSKAARSRGTTLTEGTTTIAVTPQLVNKTINVKIKVIGIHNLRSARATISGMAEGYWINEMVNNSTDVTYILESWSKEGSYGEGELYFNYTTFGLLSDPNNSTSGYEYWKGLLNLEVLLVDNKTVKKFDLPLDGSMVTENSAGDVDLTITLGFDPAGPEPPLLPDVEPEDGSGSGFDAEINDWEDEVEIPIPIG